MRPIFSCIIIEKFQQGSVRFHGGFVDGVAEKFAVFRKETVVLFQNFKYRFVVIHIELPSIIFIYHFITRYPICQRQKTFDNKK